MYIYWFVRWEFQLGIRSIIALPKFRAAVAPLMPPPKTNDVASHRLLAIAAGTLNGPVVVTAATVPTTPATVPITPTTPINFVLNDDALSSLSLFIFENSENLASINGMS